MPKSATLPPLLVNPSMVALIVWLSNRSRHGRRASVDSSCAGFHGWGFEKTGVHWVGFGEEGNTAEKGISSIAVRMREAVSSARTCKN